MIGAVVFNAKVAGVSDTLRGVRKINAFVLSCIHNSYTSVGVSTNWQVGCTYDAFPFGVVLPDATHVSTSVPRMYHLEATL